MTRRKQTSLGSLHVSFRSSRLWPEVLFFAEASYDDDEIELNDLSNYRVIIKTIIEWLVLVTVRPLETIASLMEERLPCFHKETIENGGKMIQKCRIEKFGAVPFTAQA